MQIPIYYKIGDAYVGKLEGSTNEDRKAIVDRLQKGQKVKTKISEILATNFNNAVDSTGAIAFSNPLEIFGDQIKKNDDISKQDDIILGFTRGMKEGETVTVQWTLSEVDPDKNRNNEVDTIATQVQRTPTPRAYYQIGIVVKDENNPQGVARMSMASTANLNPKAQELVFNYIANQEYDKASEIVASSNLEYDSRKGAELSSAYLEFAKYLDGRQDVVYYSDALSGLIRITADEMSKALNPNYEGPVSFALVKEKNNEFVGSKTDSVKTKIDIASDLKGFLQTKKYNVQRGVANMKTPYTSPVTNLPYETYQEYLFSSKELGEDVERIDGVGHNSILATDLVKKYQHTDEVNTYSLFNSPRVTFEKGNILGETASEVIKNTKIAETSPEAPVAPVAQPTSFKILNKEFTTEDSLFPTNANKELAAGMRVLYDSGASIELSINNVDPDNIGLGSPIQDADVDMTSFGLSVDGNNIGVLAVNSKTNEIVNVEILPEFRGLGLGTKLYKAAAVELGGLISDPSFLSNKAENIWKSLVKQGLAVKTNVKAKGTNAGYAMIDSAVQPTQQASEVKEGASEVFNDSSELSSIGTEQQYSSYLDTVFPDSKVEDIVYHLFDKFQKKVNPSNNYKGNKYNGGWFFAGRKETSESYTGSKALAKITNFLSISKDKSPNVYSILLNVKNPVIEDRKGERGIGFDEVNKAISDGKDAYIAKNVVDPNVLDDVYVVFNEENIHILGSKQDIQGFKEFVSKSAAPVEQQIKKSEYEVHVTGDMVSGWDVSTTVFNVPGIKINDLRSKTTAEGKNGRLFTESVQNNKKVFTLTDASIYRGSRPAGVSASMVFNENTTRTLESVEGNLTAIMDNLMGVIKKGSASFTPTNINFDWKKLDVKEIATPSVTMQDSEKDSAQTPIVKTIMPTVFTKDARNNPDTFKPWFIDTVSDSADNKKIYKEISNLVKIGKNLDNKITTWSLGDLRANIDGRPMVSIDIPETGESFIMYKSTGTGSGANSKGLWTPIPGFAKNGWFVKQIWNGGNPKITKYNIKTFQEIHDWLSIPGVSDSFGLEPGSKVVDSTLPSSFSMSLTVGMAATTKFKTKPGEKFQSYIPVNSEGLPIPHNPDTVNGEIIEIDKSPLLSPDIINKEVEFEIIRNDWFKKESANSTKPIHSYVPIYFKIDGKRVGKLKTGNTEDRKVIVEKLNAGEKVVSTVDTVRANNFNAAKTEDGKPWFSNPNAIGMEDVVLLFTDMDMTNGVSTVKWTAGENLNKDADGPSSDILAINREKANINSGQVGILIKDKYNPGGADRVTPGSTQFLTNKAIEAVVTNLIDKNHKIASQIVANSSEKMRSTSVSDTFLEFLTNDKQVKTMVYKSPSTNKLIRINEHELSKALSGKSYIKDVVEPTGADELSLEYTAIPQDQLTNKDIDLNVKEDFRNFLDLKKYHIDMSFGNSVGVYTSPVTNDTYKNYNEYLFSEQEIGEERADGSGHNSIFATDLVQIDGSFFHNPQVTFTKGDVNGNTAETIKADTEAKSKIKPAEKTELDNLIDEMGLLGEDTVPDCS